jgi:hypothetical protein
VFGLIWGDDGLHGGGDGVGDGVRILAPLPLVVHFSHIFVVNKGDHLSHHTNNE